tara:strand:+ start:144 stop:254 length:111 start_codon:yes stop_codon:yes gene_type:complete
MEKIIKKIKENWSYAIWYEVPLFAVAILVIATAIIF